MKTRQLLTAVAVALFTLSPAMAQMGAAGHGGGNGNGKGNQMKMELGLSQEQMNQLAQLRAKHQSEVLPLQQQVTAIRGKINDLLKAESVDRAAISRETEKIADLHKQLSEKRVNHLLEVKKVMNKDQWIKFLERDKTDGDRPHGKPGKGPGNGQNVKK